MPALVFGKYPRCQVSSPATQAVLRTLRSRGPMTDAELTEATGYERRHCQYGRQCAVDNGLVEWTGEKRPLGPKGGRSPKVWRAV